MNSTVNRILVAVRLLMPRSTAVHLSPVLYANDKDNQAVVFYFAEDAIIPDTITP